MSDDLDKRHELPAGGVPVPVPRRGVGIPTLAVAVGIALLVGAATYWGVHHWRSRGNPVGASPVPAPQDPRLAYSGPFQNIHPDVAYVGDATCAKCHGVIAATYREHPMGRSLLPVSRIDASLRYGPEAHDPFDALGTQFRIDKPRERLEFHQSARDEKGAMVYDLATPVDFALGSGTRGYSF